MKHTKQQIEGTHYNAQDMKRRLAAYRTANESTIAEPALKQFFTGNKIQIFEKDASANNDIVFDAVKIYIERYDKPKNFMHHDIKQETKRRIMVQLATEMQGAQEAFKEKMEQGIEAQLKKQKEIQIKTNQQSIREEEKEELDKKSAPIRNYLSDNLVPILTDGLIDICIRQPDDPVDILAEYLFKRSLEVPYPDPCSYIE